MSRVNDTPSYYQFPSTYRLEQYYVYGPLHRWFAAYFPEVNYTPGVITHIRGKLPQLTNKDFDSAYARISGIAAEAMLRGVKIPRSLVVVLNDCAFEEKRRDGA